MAIGVIYCETLDAETKALAADIPEANKLEPMPWGLHIDPDRLLAEVRNKILYLQGRENGDRYFMLDTNQFLCNLGQKFMPKGASHAKNPTIDNK